MSTENIYLKISKEAVNNLEKEIYGLQIGLKFNLNYLNQMKKMYLNKRTELKLFRDMLKIRLETIKMIIQTMLLKLKILKQEYKEELERYEIEITSFTENEEISYIY